MVILRTAEHADVARLATIGLSAWEQAVLGIADVAAMRSAVERGFLTFLRTRWQDVRVIDQAGTLLGWAAREDRDSLITDLWIDPAAQGAGLGSRLLDDAERQILAEGFDIAATTTHAQNTRAVDFFLRRGYSISWLSTAYSAKLDRDVESVGLRKVLVADDTGAYGFT